jgi:glycosyltransferase involved in cell wall biosynthesis
MKVCILTSAHSPYDSRIVAKEAKALVDNNMEVVLIAPKEPKCPSKEYNYLGIKVKTLSIFRNTSDISKILRYIRLLSTIIIFFKGLKEKPDIFHFHDPDLLPIAFLLKKLTKSKVIYDVHEYYSEAIISKLWIPLRIRHFVANYFNKLEKNIVKKLDGVITIDENMTKEFARYAKKIESIHNYVEMEFVSRLQIQIQNFTANRNKEGKVIIYIGVIDKDRGLEILFKCMEVVVNNYQGKVSCYIVGPVDLNGMDNIIRQNLDNYIKKGNIILVGEISRKDIPAYLAKADICVIPWLGTPNQLKGRPRKLYEYMASGKPLVVSNFGILEQVIEESKCGLTAITGDYMDFAKKIMHLLNNEIFCKELGENGYKAVIDNYNWDSEIPKLIKFYYDITSN